jgi:tRNA (guanosine-2'-O-)-methyltransferase
VKRGTDDRDPATFGPAARELRVRAALDRRIGGVRCAIEGLYHRHNTSAILRTCEAMGIQHVHLVDGGSHLSRGPARGAERWLDLHVHRDAQQAIQAVRDAGFAIWIADLADPPVPPEAVPLDRPVCVWFGAELIGVAPEVRAVADGVVTIPMHGLAQSLNVSVAAALTLRPLAERARAGGDVLALAEREAIAARWRSRDSADPPET